MNEQELQKRKYKREEVREIVCKVEEEYKETVNELKEKNSSLIEENKYLTSKLEGYKNQETLINSAIKSAEQKAQDTIKKAQLKYALEVENLRTFCVRFTEYFEEISKKFPQNKTVKEAEAVFRAVRESIEENGKTDRKKVEDVKKGINGGEIKGKKGFNPKERIEEYIASTGDNGFNLDEVLNPGELHLEDLCKELGLIDE